MGRLSSFLGGKSQLKDDTRARDQRRTAAALKSSQNAEDIAEAPKPKGPRAKPWYQNAPPFVSSNQHVSIKPRLPATTEQNVATPPIDAGGIFQGEDVEHHRHPVMQTYSRSDTLGRDSSGSPFIMNPGMETVWSTNSRARALKMSQGSLPAEPNSDGDHAGEYNVDGLIRHKTPVPVFSKSTEQGLKRRSVGQGETNMRREPRGTRSQTPQQQVSLQYFSQHVLTQSNLTIQQGQFHEDEPQDEEGALDSSQGGGINNVPQVGEEPKSGGNRKDQSPRNKQKEAQKSNNETGHQASTLESQVGSLREDSYQGSEDEQVQDERFNEAGLNQTPIVSKGSKGHPEVCEESASNIESSSNAPVTESAVKPRYENDRNGSPRIDEGPGISTDIREMKQDVSGTESKKTRTGSMEKKQVTAAHAGTEQDMSGAGRDSSVDFKALQDRVTILELEKQIRQIQDDLRVAQDKHKTDSQKFISELERANTVAKSKNLEMEELKIQQAVEIQKAKKQLKIEIETLKDDCIRLEASKDKLISDMKQAHSSNIEIATQPLRSKIDQLEKELENLEKSKRSEIAALEKEHYGKIEAEKTSMHSRIWDLQQNLKDTENTRNQYFRESKDLREKERELKGQLAQAITQWEISTSQNAQTRVDHAQSMERTQKDFVRQLGQVEFEMHGLKREHEKAISAVWDSYRELETSAKLRTTEVESAHQEEIRRIRENYQLRIDDLESESKQKTRKKDMEIEAILEANKASVAQMIVDNQKEITEAVRKLKADNEALLRQSVKKDIFKALTDTELEEGFAGIRQEVDELARIEWKSGYPISEYSMQHVKYKREAKQHFIQTTLWVSLFHGVFCTPFRALGPEGTALEQKWIQKFGQDGKTANVPCARATKVSEQFRYEAIAKCLAEMQNPNQESQRIKEGYNSTLSGLTEKIFRDLQSITTETYMRDHDISKQRVAELVKWAAKWWLEIGKQRFRTTIVMSESGDVPVPVSQNALNQRSALNIVVFPGLLRVGNAQGGQLETAEFVAGCEPQFDVFRLHS